jgi:hypothetical protein
MSELPSLHALRLSDDPPAPTGPKYGRDSEKDPIENMGLYLGSDLFPYGRDASSRNVQLSEMATYKLTRSNFGARGVLWQNRGMRGGYDATVLFISDAGQYDDEYLQFMHMQRRRLSSVTHGIKDLPEILYDYPKQSGPPSQYNQAAKKHLDGLKVDASNPSLLYTDLFTQPMSKVYVFFKLKVTGEERFANSGGYLFFGRFQVMPPTAGDNPAKIRLRRYEPPMAAKLEARQMVRGPGFVSSLPRPVVSREDVNTVVSALETMSSKHSSTRRAMPDRPSARGGTVDDDDDDLFGPPPSPPIPSAPPQERRNAASYRIPRKSANPAVVPADDDLEDGEIQE